MEFLAAMTPAVSTFLTPHSLSFSVSVCLSLSYGLSASKNCDLSSLTFGI